ncbi:MULTISPECIES: primosomal protein DnaI [Bacillaceae]|uniref:Primosomal protein DnaI n=1 Tax=Alkalicoccobacillus plakortidis TaxID=444060 RepID=A0A9D5DUP4_9BACI|nr:MULTISPECIES: primosomal protein DnaI [Bacillaceae]KQL57512.1 primosomal protein DnaI [Alkalicoccobacillus plakortidis]
MDSIQKSFAAMDKGGRLQKQIAEQKKRVVLSKPVQSFLREANEVTEDMIDRGLSKLYEFKKEREHCETCPGLENCPNMMQGYRPSVYVERGSLELTYSKCPLKVDDEEKKLQQGMIQSFYIPKDVLEATFDLIEQDSDRTKAITEAIKFASTAQPGENGHGLYLYGKFGVGKSYLLGAIANDLKESRIQSALIYTPDFFREMKAAIGDGTFQEKLEVVRRVPVLMLDDIGAETTTAWTRDEILGPIMQYRMSERLPTVFTSNYDYDELEVQLAYSDKGGTEELKAKRIMERIKHFTTLVEVKGKNRRS